jgi:cytochrome c-type biogenesis protein CcmE
VHDKRRTRMVTIIFLLVGVATAAALVLKALNENTVGFYPPEKIVNGEAPSNRQIRAGGMVLEKSVKRLSDGISVEFVLTDYKGSNFSVAYTGILPDLFREGQGIVVRGNLDDLGIFKAEEVLAKHDENYMPKELTDLDSVSR